MLKFKDTTLFTEIMKETINEEACFLKKKKKKRNNESDYKRIIK